MHRRHFRIAAVAALVGLAGPALAHHSYGMFDRGRTKDIVGTVKQFDWTNPHAHLLVDVRGTDGATATWNLELNPPGSLVRKGWKKASLKPGDAVTVKITPLRDNRPGGHLEAVTTADGRTFSDGLPGLDHAPQVSAAKTTNP